MYSYDTSESVTEDNNIIETCTLPDRFSPFFFVGASGDVIMIVSTEDLSDLLWLIDETLRDNAMHVFTAVLTWARWNALATAVLTASQCYHIFFLKNSVIY